MDDSQKAGAATPASTLRDYIMDPRYSKTESEHWAAIHIERLEFELAAKEREISRLRMALGEIAHHHTKGVGCNPENFVKQARDALGQE